MAAILEFRVPPHSKPETSGIRNSDAPQIIIFPGVRYERWSDEPQPRRRKRSKSKSEESQRAD